ERQDVRVPVPVQLALRVAEQLRRYVWYWAPVPPLLLALCVLGWVSTRRAQSIQSGSTAGFLRWIPLMRSMSAGDAAAGFADLLALLIEHRVPYPEALLLAGDASGDPAMSRDVRVISTAIANGLEPSEATGAATALPPLLRWVLATASQQGDLVG